MTRGSKTGSSAFDTCTDFSADATEYLGTGQGAGVVYKGTLQGYPDSWSAGLVDAPGAAETWTANEKHAYKIRVELPSSASSTAAGLTANQQFTWEARNQ